MSICPEAAAFLGVPRVTVQATRSVRLLTGKEEAEDLADDIPKFINRTEDTMPNSTEAVKPKRKYTRRQPKLMMSLDEAPVKNRPGPKKAKALDVIFSIDSTGALLIRRGDHGMEFSAVEVDELMAFMEKSRILWAPD